MQNKIQTNSELNRKDHARRMILLGSFLKQHFEVNPDLKKTLIPEIIQFLDQHKNPKIAQVNKDLLSDILEGSHTS